MPTTAKSHELTENVSCVDSDRKERELGTSRLSLLLDQIEGLTTWY